MGNIRKNNNQSGIIYSADGISPTIDARGSKDPVKIIDTVGGGTDRVEQIGNIFPTKTRDNPNQGRVYDTDYIAPALNCMGGGNREPYIAETEVLNAEDDGTCRTIKANYAKMSYANFNRDGGSMGATGVKTIVRKQTTVRERIRKLMPIECFRLQGFDDESFRKAESVCSNSQLYKQAGNSITVDVLCYIFRALDDAKNGIEKYNADKNGQYTFF